MSDPRNGPVGRIREVREDAGEEDNIGLQWRSRHFLGKWEAHIGELHSQCIEDTHLTENGYRWGWKHCFD